MLASVVLPVMLGTLGLAADDWSPPNLVKNPGFETVTENGAPGDWDADRTVYITVTEPVHSGQRALRFANPDANRYVLCSQRIPLQPGKAYEVRVWVKTENIQGDDSGATICLEWYSADGKYLGGCYPAGFKGTVDWQQVKAVSGRVPREAAACNVTCYVREHMTGKAWWDDVEVRLWREPPLHTLLLTPNYRGEIGPERRPLEVAARLALADYDLQPRQVRLRADLVRAGDGSLVQTRYWAPKTAETVLRLGTKRLQPGRYDLRVALESGRDRHELGRESWRLRVFDAALTGRAAYIDAHNRLICEGKPFFPLGMYWGAINEADLRVYADSPFNCLMPYGPPTKEQMDLAHSLGLKVIYTVKDVYYGSTYVEGGLKTIEDERRVIEAKTREFRDHPALLAWYLNDELPLDYLDRLEAHQEWLEELDPGHPTWVVLWQVGQLESYVRTFGAIGTDPYPIPGSPARMAGQWARQTVQSVRGRRPVWMVPQVFNWACYREDPKEKAGLRPPTLAEMRSMAWQCIAEGATGLVFYSFFDIQRDTVVPFDQQWALVKQMAGEIKELIPVVLSVEPTPRIRAEEQPWLHWTTRRLGRTVYLIAVNDDETGHRATFELGKCPTSVRLRGVRDALAVQGTQLQARFGRFGVNLYEMEF